MPSHNAAAPLGGRLCAPGGAAFWGRLRSPLPASLVAVDPREVSAQKSAPPAPPCPQPGPSLPLSPHTTGAAPHLRAAVGAGERQSPCPHRGVTIKPGDGEVRAELGSKCSELRKKTCRVLRVAVCAVSGILIVVLVAVTVLRHREPCSPRPDFSHVCPSDTVGFQGKCYYFSDTESDWNSSREHCKALGASLATIDTQEEKDFMLRYRGQDNCWIGLHRAGEDEPWTWADGSAFNSWFEVRGGGRCAYLNGDRISSASCHIKKLWVCSRADSYVLWRNGTPPQ